MMPGRNVVLASYGTVVLERVTRVLLHGIDGGALISLAAALLFAAHPVHTEDVAGLKRRGVMLR